MKNLLSQRQFGESFPYAVLGKVWYVDADSTYHSVKRPNADFPEYVIVRVIKGSGTLTDRANNAFRLLPNTFCVFRSSDIAMCEAGPDGLEFFWFRFDDSDWPGTCNFTSSIFITPSEKKDMERCFLYLNSMNRREAMFAEAIFNHLLCNWIQELNTGAEETLTLEVIEALLEKWDTESLTLSEIVSEAGVSERTFRDTVKRVCGLAPKEYVTKQKMQTALELLLTTKMTVTEVSEYFKYDNPFYFSRVFKNYFGFSPKKLQQSVARRLIGIQFGGTPGKAAK